MAGGPILLSTIANSLKKTLDQVLMDEDKSDTMVLNKYFDMKPMTDAYHDDLDMAGPGLAARKEVGAQVALGSIVEGVMWRYIAETYGIKLTVAEEVIEDGKYPEAVNRQKYNADAMYLTCEYTAASVLINRDDTSYLGGDGQPLASLTHPLTRGGGSYQNRLTTPAGPSQAAVGLVVAELLVQPGRDGYIRGTTPRGVVYPANQWDTWATVLMSDKNPAAGQFNAINTLRSQKWSLEPIMVPYWQGAPNDWAVLTNVRNGLCWRWRRKPRSRSWVDNDTTTVHSAMTMRFGLGWSDPRSIYFGGSST
jgi:hypothetical protein